MFELLTQQEGLFVFVAAILGLMVGSFLNVVVHRVPKMLEREWREQCAWLQGKEPEKVDRYNLLLPSSTCPQCGHAIRWYENIPVVSWLALSGRCSQCKATIAWRYPLVESFTGLVFAFAAWKWGAGAEVVWVWGLLALLIALTFIDFDTQLLPDSLTLPLIWAGLLANLSGRFVPLDEAVLGAMVGYCSLWLVYHLFKFLTGKEGMGFGDFKLLAALGAWLGWKMLLPIVLLASLSGALVGISLILFRGQARSKPIPFGPWLAMGGLVSLFWGAELLQFWLG
jgi:leader peptidase (prepilin peptidase)/N-methyltransferase